MFSMLFSGREQIIRDLGLSNLYCLIPFLGGFNDFGGWDQTSQDLKARNFRWNPAEHKSASKAKKPASLADVTSALAPDLVSTGREPEHHNFKHS